MTPVDFYVDGACAGMHLSERHRRCGAGIVGIAGGSRRTWSVPLPGAVTNNQAELLAVEMALAFLTRPVKRAVTVYSDSAYVVGVLGGDKTARVNLEQVARIRALMERCGAITFRHLAGHAGHPEQEEADTLARAACNITACFP
jgi:ribonuclease HI